MPTGGDILEVAVNHSVLGSYTWYPKAGEASSWDLGGYTSEDNAQGIDGGGRFIDKMSRKRPFVSITPSWEMNNGNDLKVAQDHMDSPILGTYTITHVNGSIWQLQGKPVGDLTGDGGAATFPLKISGTGKTKKIN